MRPKLRASRAALIAGLAQILGAGCESETGVLIEVEALDGVHEAVDLKVEFAHGSDRHEKVLVPLTGSLFRPGGSRTTQFGILAGGRSGPFEVEVTARDADKRGVAAGRARGSIVGGEEVTLHVALHPFDFQVNNGPGTGQQYFSTHAAGRQVAGDAQGNFIVVWQQSCGGAGQVCQIYGRLFDEQGNPRLNGQSGRDTEYVLSTRGETNYDMPAVAMQPNGSFVVVWKRLDSVESSAKGAIYAFAFRTDGRPINEEEGEMLLSRADDTSLDTSTPDVVALADGSYLVVWEQWRPGEKVLVEIAGRLVGADGRPLPGPTPGEPFILAAFEASYPSEKSCSGAGDLDCLAGESCGPLGTCVRSDSAPAAAAFPEGDAVVVWRQAGMAQAQLIDGAGETTGGAIDVAQYQVGQSAGRVSAIDVAALDDRFVVVWSDQVSSGADTDGSSIWLRRFDAKGQALADGYVLNTSVAGDQGAPTIARYDDGSVLVAWSSSESAADDPEGGVRGRLLLDNGLPVGGDFRLNTTVTGQQAEPALSPRKPAGLILAFVDDSKAGPDVDGKGIRARLIYPDESTVQGQIGAPCDQANACNAELFCASTKAGSRCVSTCKAADDACPNGGRCVQASETAQFVCLYDVP